MKTYNGVWDELDGVGIEQGALQRRVLADSSHDVRLLNDASRGLVLEMNLIGTVSALPLGDPSTRGLEVHCTSPDPHTCRVSVRLRQKSMRRQFIDVTDDLIGLVRTSPADGVAARVVGRLHAWKSFFSQPTVLSQSAAAGLFAELHVMRTMLAPRIGTSQAVQRWTGPIPARQDFELPNGAIEVKSWRGDGPAEVRISSQHQLDTASGRIWLVVVSLEQKSDGPGETLGDQVRELEAQVGHDPARLLELETKLLQAGWHPRVAAERTEKYSIRVAQTYEVRSGFPRLLPGTLPEGIKSVSYILNTAVIDAFQVSNDTAITEATQAHE